MAVADTQGATPAAGSTPREAAGRNTHGRVFDALCRYVPEGTVLEIPCGSGAFLQRLRAAGYRVVGADLDPTILRHQPPSMVADMSAPLPLPSDAVDAVVSIEGIEHIHRPFDFVRECRRVLKSGGYLILTTPNISSARSRWRWLLTGFHNKAKYPLDETQPALRHHITMLPFPALRYMLHTQGFSLVAVHTNRVKAASLLYAPWWPLQWLLTRLILPRGAKSREHERAIGDTRSQLNSAPVFFGEALILVARAR